MMDDLSILIARLGWPSTATRWWTMQELAARLGESASKATTEAALLRFLSSRKLEAEVVEALCVFWIAVQMHRYKASQKLAQSIPNPSILSDLLLECLGLRVDIPIANLEEVNDNFAIPQDFNGVQGADLPRIFHTIMANAERNTGFPFVRQMAFEWSLNKDIYPDAPFQGDPWYFSRPLGDGFICNISSRTAIRMISAYLRTLSVAKEVWGIPPEWMEEMALLALPVHPTLALLRPMRPSWFPSRSGFDGSNEEIDATVQSLIEQVQTEFPGDELIAFTSPIVISIDRCVEVSVVRWHQASGGCIGDDNLAEHLKDFWCSGQTLQSYAPEPLGTMTIFMSPALYSSADEKSRAWPLAMPIDMDRLGYLQHDLYPRRLFLPTMPSHKLIEVVPSNKKLEVTSKNKVVADLYYWNVGWGPVRPMQFDGNCGTALLSRGKAYREQPNVADQNMRSFYLWRVRTLNRKGSFGIFDEKLSVGVVFV